MKKHYGIRYFSTNRNCTTGEPHPLTGRMSKACEIVVFDTKPELDNWMSEEKLSSPSGLGGGERIKASKNTCRKHCLGMSVEAFEEELTYYNNS